MSWIDKELKRRAKAVQAEAVVRESEAERRDPTRLMVELWQRFEAANAALPEALRLRVERVDSLPVQGPRFQTWLRADNGAALGFAGDAIRYVWPERNAKKSRNFWIRWNTDRDRPEVMRRVGSATPPLMVSWPFDTRRIDFVLRELVRGRHVAARGLRRRRFWLF
jgi:hypothetical protein